VHWISRCFRSWAMVHYLKFRAAPVPEFRVRRCPWRLEVRQIFHRFFSILMLVSL
jgi:hypothetical protein